MYEKLDIYDIDRNKTGRVIERRKDESINKDEYIVAVQCLIFNLKGELLLTQRKHNKIHGGMWEPTSGLIKSGESSLCGIKRELYEEIGLKVSDSEINLYKTNIENKAEVNIIRDIYIIHKDIKLSNLKFIDGEVIDAKYVNIDEFKSMIDNKEAFEWLEWVLTEYYKMQIIKYVRVMDGKKSNASGFDYKIDEVNVSNQWNPTTYDPAIMGGFNFSSENKILRWLHRGDTIYDVKIPDDAEIIDCPSTNCPHGVFRSNKIILSNPKKITEEMVIDLYKKSDLPEKTYYQCLVVLLYRNYMKAIKYIINDRINKSNIDNCIKEFETFISDKHDGQTHKFIYEELWDEAKEIYDLLIKIKQYD